MDGSKSEEDVSIYLVVSLVQQRVHTAAAQCASQTDTNFRTLHSGHVGQVGAPPEGGVGPLVLYIWTFTTETNPTN